MRRIAVIGNGGSGKSSLSRRLGGLLGIPVIHLDREQWKPGWVMTPKEEWHARMRELAGGESWIMDGNYGGTQHVSLPAADTIIFLDFPRLICVYRVFRRWVEALGGAVRPDMAEGCREKVDPEFLLWIWNFNSHSRPRVLERLSRYGRGRRVVILRRPGEVERFVREIEERTRVVPS